MMKMIRSPQNNNKNSNKLQCRIVSIVFAALCLFFISGCDFSGLLPDAEQPTEPTDPVTARIPFTLSYRTDDVLDPYKCKGRTNYELMGLCFDRLIYVNKNYDPVAVLCTGWSLNSNSATVNLRQDILFSDGTPLTAADCVYSFNTAKSCGGIYASRFDRILSWEAVNDYTFTVTFTDGNVNNVNLLDIPVIKKGTASSPVGTGRYILVQSEQSVALYKNENSAFCRSGGEYGIEKIELLGLSSAEDQLFSLNYGKIHALYSDLSYGNYAFRGNIETVRYTDNNLIFAMVNPKKEYLASPDATLGIFYSVNREQLVHDVFGANATAAWYPFCPAWSVTRAAALNEDIFSSEIAHEHFVNAGLPLAKLKRTWQGQPIQLSILVNIENRNKLKVAYEVADDLTNMGFDTVVEIMKQTDYASAVAAGEYDIYIGEIALPANMDFSVMLTQGVCADDTIFSAELRTAINDFNSGNTDMRSLLGIFRQYPPFIPILYTRSALAVNRVVSGEFDPNSTSLYTGIEKWQFKYE